MSGYNVRSKEECKQLVSEIFSDKSERHNALETINMMLCDVQLMMDDLDQDIKKGEFKPALTNHISEGMFCSHIRTIAAVIGVVRASLIASAAEERGGTVPIKDFDMQAIPVLKAAIIKAVEDTAY